MSGTQKVATLGAGLVAVAVAAMGGRAGAQAVSPRPDDLRFQAVLNEPIATPDRRAVVAGSSALVVKDRKTGQCFVAITIGGSMGLSPIACDP